MFRSSSLFFLFVFGGGQSSAFALHGGNNSNGNNGIGRISGTTLSSRPTNQRLNFPRQQEQKNRLWSYKFHKQQQQQQQQVSAYQQFESAASKTTTSLLQVRGGGVGEGGENRQNIETSNKSNVPVKNVIVWTATLAISIWFLWSTREGWSAFFNKDKLQAKTLEILKKLNSYPKYQSYPLYTIVFAIYEAGGLSTIPVETAAGMVFGWDGFYLNALGKLLGAILAFCLGRYGILANWIQSKLANNEFLSLLKTSAGKNPFLVSIYMKLSCFPETIKNYGSAILKPIQLWMFASATIVHGGTFSALWTYFGVDTAKRLANPSYPTDKLLGTLLTLAVVNGFVISPVAMGMWIRNLKKTASQSSSSSSNEAGNQ